MGSIPNVNMMILDVTEYVETPYDVLVKKQLYYDCLRILFTIIMSDRDRKIILMRYGFWTGEELSYPEIARKMGISSARVRQIDIKFLRNCRHRDRLKLLKPYL